MDSPGELDSWVASSYEHLVNGISTMFTPLRPYEDFAANVGDWLEEDTNISLVHCVPKNGLHYFLTFTVEYEGNDKTLCTESLPLTSLSHLRRSSL